MPRHLRTTLPGTLAALLLLAGCGGGDGGTAPPSATTGSLAVTISGLPSDVAPSVVVAGPSGYSTTLTAGSTLTGLTPGSYTVTPIVVFDKGIGYSGAGVGATISAGGAAAAGAAYALRILPRSTTERVDVTAASQIKLMYVLPSDGVDRGLDTNGTIHRTISSGQRWLASQTGGRYIRYDVFNGGLDIVFVRAPRTDAAYYSYGAQILDSLQKDLNAAGWNRAQVLNLLYYDGRHIDRCGSAVWPPNVPGNTGAIYLKGAPTATLPCAGNAFAASPTAAPGYLDFIAQHEIFHMLGIVSTAAPNHALAGHVGNDPTDLMYAGTLPWRPATVDVTKTNYYSATGLASGLRNFATSPYVQVP
jgi:hypothetical protein